MHVVLIGFQLVGQCAYSFTVESDTHNACFHIISIGKFSNTTIPLLLCYGDVEI